MTSNVIIDEDEDEDEDDCNDDEEEEEEDDCSTIIASDHDEADNDNDVDSDNDDDDDDDDTILMNNNICPALFQLLAPFGYYTYFGIDLFATSTTTMTTTTTYNNNLNKNKNNKNNITKLIHSSSSIIPEKEYVNKMYRKLALLHHPDRMRRVGGGIGGDNTTNSNCASANTFRVLNRAKQVLLNYKLCYKYIYKNHGTDFHVALTLLNNIQEKHKDGIITRILQNNNNKHNNNNIHNNYNNNYHGKQCCSNQQRSNTNHNNNNKEGKKTIILDNELSDDYNIFDIFNFFGIDNLTCTNNQHQQQHEGPRKNNSSSSQQQQQQSGNGDRFLNPQQLRHHQQASTAKTEKKENNEENIRIIQQTEQDIVHELIRAIKWGFVLLLKRTMMVGIISAVIVRSKLTLFVSLIYLGFVGLGFFVDPHVKENDYRYPTKNKFKNFLSCSMIAGAMILMYQGQKCQSVYYNDVKPFNSTHFVQFWVGEAFLIGKFTYNSILCTNIFVLSSSSSLPPSYNNTYCIIMSFLVIFSLLAALWLEGCVRKYAQLLLFMGLMALIAAFFSPIMIYFLEAEFKQKSIEEAKDLRCQKIIMQNDKNALTEKPNTSKNFR